MKKFIEEIHMLRARAEVSINRTSRIEQVLAQIEASLTKKEDDKVREKAKNL